MVLIFTVNNQFFNLFNKGLLLAIVRNLELCTSWQESLRLQHAHSAVHDDEPGLAAFSICKGTPAQLATFAHLNIRGPIEYPGRIAKVLDRVQISTENLLKFRDRIVFVELVLRDEVSHLMDAGVSSVLLKIIVIRQGTLNMLGRVFMVVVFYVCLGFNRPN